MSRVRAAGLSGTNGMFLVTPSFSVWEAISGKALIAWPRLEWTVAWNMIVDRTRNENSVTKKIMGIVIAASVYYLWQERNKRLHDNHFTGTETIIAEISGSIRVGLKALCFWSCLVQIFSGLVVRPSCLVICGLWGFLSFGAGRVLFGVLVLSLGLRECLFVLGLSLCFLACFILGRSLLSFAVEAFGLSGLGSSLIAAEGFSFGLGF
ncbi:hypothetical protein OIU76_021732 [Salix suchowensis]|nr:hypothetical protein OIU76_021732 [Salix suchowensis]